MLSKQDLLFAHATLCDYARYNTGLKREFANRLCTVINNFQVELKSELKPEAKRFQVMGGKCCHVSPVGGWNVS